MADSEQDRRSLLPSRIGGAGGGSGMPPPPPEEGDGGDGMLRMSCLQHLEELRARLIKAIVGGLVAFVACIGFGPWLWDIISAPATAALMKIGLKDPRLVATEPMEGF